MTKIGISKEVRSSHFEWQPLTWRNLHFRNRLGLAGGVDKVGNAIPHWWNLGVGFVELGTITPEPQQQNPGAVLARNNSEEALWNRLGFPSLGLNACKEAIQNWPLPFPTPVFANIGKNRTTPNENAADDYCRLMTQLHSLVDGFVINISSPNTQGLRELLLPENFRKFLKPICQARKDLSKNFPLLLKLSPDMELSELKSVIDISLELELDGWVLTNTTLHRPQGIDFPADGGLSGKPLRELSLRALKTVTQHLGDARKERLIISVGGISSAKDVQERLEMGADLVEIYSAIVFQGPFFFANTLRELTKS